MYLFGGERSYGNGDINSYINAYMNTSEKAEFIASILRIERFSKSGISIHNSEVSEKMGKRIQAIAKHYTLQAKVKKGPCQT